MSDPVVTVAQGQLKGRKTATCFGDEYFSFQGVPYAKAPVGNLRFADPERPEPWVGLFDATKEGPECPATSMFLPYNIGKEDNCLNLNVYTKTIPDTNNVKYPVMVWIHGGAFVVGSNKTGVYGPDFLLLDDVVLVTINYRLGPFGFLCLEDSTLGVPGNAGVKDQVMALRWVKDNIEYFNGDPNNVTIFGESAGGASVHYLVISPLAKGLFHKAIIQSGFSTLPWAVGVRGSTELCRRLGCKETDERKVLEYLRNLPASSLTNARIKSRDRFRAGEQRYYAPVVEKPSPTAFITDTPENIIKSGNYNKVPMIIGCTSKEGLLFELVRKAMYYAEYPIQNFIREIDFRLKVPPEEDKQKELTERVKQFYSWDKKDGSLIHEGTVMLKTDTMFMYGMQKGAKLHLDTSDQPIYLYEMSLETEGLNLPKKIYTAHWFRTHLMFLVVLTRLGEGCLRSCVESVLKWFRFGDMEGPAHGDDISYLFKSDMHHNILSGSDEEKSVRKFVRLWTNFARYGDPTPTTDDGLIDARWEPMDKEFTYLDIGNELKVGKHLNRERFEFWEAIYKEFR